MQASKSSSYLITKIYEGYKLTVIYTISSIIMAIDSLNGESRFRNQYRNDDLSEETKRTFNNIENLYKYLKSNIEDSEIVTIEAPGKVIVAYFHEEDQVIKSKYLTYNLSLRKSRNSEKAQSQELQPKFEELYDRQEQVSQIKQVKKQNDFNFQVNSLKQENNVLKQKLAAMEIRYSKDLQTLQRKFDKKIIQLYQLIEENQEKFPIIKSQVIPKEYRERQNPINGSKVTEQRIRFLELQFETLKGHPLLVGSNYGIKIGKNIWTNTKRTYDRFFEAYAKPAIQKYGQKVHKVAYYGFFGAAQLFALLIAFLTIRFMIWPVLKAIF